MSGALGWFTVGQRRDVGDQCPALARMWAAPPGWCSTRSRRPSRFGAAELAGRWSWVDLDDRDAHGGRMHVLGAGFNWYWNRWIRWQANYELALTDGGAIDGRLHVFQARFQLVL